MGTPGCLGGIFDEDGRMNDMATIFLKMFSCTAEPNGSIKKVHSTKEGWTYVEASSRYGGYRDNTLRRLHKLANVNSMRKGGYMNMKTTKLLMEPRGHIDQFCTAKEYIFLDGSSFFAEMEGTLRDNEK